eukprot:tig00000093_g3613.t1
MELEVEEVPPEPAPAKQDSSRQSPVKQSAPLEADSSADSDPLEEVELTTPALFVTNGSFGLEDVASEASSEGDGFASDDDSQDQSWVNWFCRLKGNEFFVEVDDEWIQDDFNLHGLNQQVPAPFYEAALDLILDSESQEDSLSEEQQELLESAAELLYGLIHARYLLTARGTQQMLEKYKRGVFGRCPRVLCDGQEVLPVGENDLPRHSHVQLFCPKCEEIYRPPNRPHRLLDGAYFGTSFPHVFLQCNPELLVTRQPAKYVPRVFGFKVFRGPPPDPSAPSSSAPPSSTSPSAATPPFPALGPAPPLPTESPPPAAGAPGGGGGPTSDGRKGKGTKKKAVNQGSNGMGKVGKFGT